MRAIVVISFSEMMWGLYPYKNKSITKATEKAHVIYAWDELNLDVIDAECHCCCLIVITVTF